jgi:hypothetical protein
MTYRKYSNEDLQKAVDNSTSLAGVVRYFNRPQAGGTQSHLAHRIKEADIDTSHFTGQAHNKGKIFPDKRKPKEGILVMLPAGSHRTHGVHLARAMIESGIPSKCALCQITDSWNGLPIKLEVDHFDGDWLNNRINNLRFLCPNCHSQQKNSNLPSKYRNWTNPKLLCECGKNKTRLAVKCKDCFIKDKASDKKELKNSKTSPKTKIIWPDNEEIVRQVMDIGYLSYSKQLGVSDVAIRKHLKKTMAEIPTGYPKKRIF